MELTEKYESQGVFVMEVLQAATSQKILVDWMRDYDYFGARTEPADLLKTDFEKTEILPEMCVFVIIDLRNMRVLESNCGQCHDLMAEECIDEALALL